MSVGVVIPVLDAVSTIDAALDSVVAEAPVVARIVVVDGGSTDGTLARIARRSDVEVLAQVGRGLAAARNQGIATLRTDLVAFCDADDQWCEGGLSARLDHLATHRTCAAVAGSVVTKPIDGQEGRRDQLGRRLSGYTPGALLMRRSVFEKTGEFDERLRIASDSAWFAKLIDSGLRLDLLDEVVLVKGIRSGSLSSDVSRYGSELLSVLRQRLRERRDGPRSHRQRQR